MSLSRASGFVSGLYLFIGEPLLSTKNFSKFQVISAMQIGFQSTRVLSKITSVVGPQRVFRKIYIAEIFTPLTNTLAKRGKRGTNPFPGLTYFKQFKISSFFPGSWFRNCAQGKANIWNPRELYFW